MPHPALTRRDLPALLAALALLLALPALWAGWQFDDYVQRERLLAAPGPAGLRPATMELFTFLGADPAETQRRIDRGELAWWTLPTARTAFWRPLSGLTHWLDYQLWPDQPALMHLHSLIWLMALAAAVAALYRRLLGPTAVAGLAALLYTVDDARGFAAGWLANRNALCAALFGALAIMAHLRWRGGGRPRHLAASLLALGCALLSAEAGVATLAYLAAHALWLDRAPGARRALALLPALAVVAAWRAIYRALGYGAWGTAYLDPLGEPLPYLRELLWRGPLLLLGQWSPMPAEISPFLPPPAGWALWLIALALLAALALALRPLLRADRHARFWATGMLLALPPACAALPANRLLFFVGIGAMGLAAQAIAGGAAEAGQRSADSADTTDSADTGQRSTDSADTTDTGQRMPDKAPATPGRMAYARHDPHRSADSADTTDTGHTGQRMPDKAPATPGRMAYARHDPHCSADSADTTDTGHTGQRIPAKAPATPGRMAYARHDPHRSAERADTTDTTDTGHRSAESAGTRRRPSAFCILHFALPRYLILTHLILAPLLLPLTALSPALLGGADRAAATLPADAGVAGRTLVAVAAPSVFSLSAVGVIRAEAGLPAPARTLLLAPGLLGVRVERPDARTLVAWPEGGYLLGFDGVFRAPWRPLGLGEAVRLPGVTITVVALTPDGRPAAAAFRFDTPLEDPARQWLIWDGAAFVPFALPAVGEQSK